MKTKMTYNLRPRLKLEVEEILGVSAKNRGKVGREWWESPEKSIFEKFLAGIVLLSPPTLGTLAVAGLATFISNVEEPLIIKLDCAPPGRNAPVKVWKLRTMNSKGPTSRSRVTKVGKIFRKVSIDEIPQLINVLRSELSLIAPRPFSPEEWRNIILPNKDKEPYEGFLKFVNEGAPFGLIDLYGVLGRKELTPQDRCYLSMMYYKHASFRLDLELLRRVFPAIASMRGAY